MALTHIIMHILGLFVFVYGDTDWRGGVPGVPGVPDYRQLKTKKSRSTGTGPIGFGHAIVAFGAFALFIALLGLVLFYKREKGIRSREKTLYITTF